MATRALFLGGFAFESSGATESNQPLKKSFSESPSAAGDEGDGTTETSGDFRVACFKIQGTL